MFLRTLIILSVVCFSSLRPAYAIRDTSGCDYERHFKIMVMQSNPAKPTPPLKLMTPISDNIGTGFTYLSAASSSTDIVVNAHCWALSLFKNRLADHLSHDGNTSSGSLRLTVGSDADHQVNVIIYVDRPIFGGYHTTVIAAPTGSSVRMPYQLMTPEKNASGKGGMLPLIFRAS